MHKVQVSSFQELKLSDVFHFSSLFIHITSPVITLPSRTVIFPRRVFIPVVLLPGTATSVTA